jgi:hypothetical protein
MHRPEGKRPLGRLRHRWKDGSRMDLREIGEPGSSVSTVTGYGLDDRGSIPGGGGGFFLYPLRPACSGAHPASHSGYRGPSPGVNSAGACC